jgi:endonuclease/exonuclease/phosphatase family metal-dependent hydrolase
MARQFFRKASKTILITSNLVLAICLIIGCYGGLIQNQSFWFTGLFTLASFYFLLLLTGFLIFWLFVRAKYALISAICIIVCFPPLRDLVKLRLNDGFSVAKKKGALRVMSWNVEHFEIRSHNRNPEIKAAMLATINEMQPDIACFQEMVASETDNRAINYLPDFLQELGLPYYHYAYNPKLDYDSKHHFGIIIFSKYPIINSKTCSYPPHDYNSIFQYADMVKGTDTFRVFNVHLQSLKFTASNKSYINDPSMNDQTDLEKSKSVVSKLKTGFIKRFRQSNHIRESIEQSPYPVLVCGDFNDVPNSYAYYTIGKGLKNAFSEKGSGIGNTFDGIAPTLRIDQIFTDPRFEIIQYKRIRKKLSDHFPLVTDLQWNNKE